MFRLNMTEDPGYSRIFRKDTIMLMVVGDTEQKLLEDDIVSFTAASSGLHSYTSIMGATIELPIVAAAGPDVGIVGRDE